MFGHKVDQLEIYVLVGRLDCDARKNGSLFIFLGLRSVESVVGERVNDDFASDDLRNFDLTEFIMPGISK